jgi:predicted amidohydrolase YtcJ
MKLKSLLLAACTIVSLQSAAAAQSVDQILTNGKIVTVDDHFSIAQALAIRGERIVAVGTDAEIDKLKSAATRVVDLKGRTVIPGLIDNHAHYMRAAEYWNREVRLDGVTEHKKALQLIAAKVRQSKPGEWIMTLGGWSEEQFTDEKRGFTKAELDEIAPANPVVLQLIYFRIYTNTTALKALGVDEKAPDPARGKFEKNAQGLPTGVFNGAGAVAWTLTKLGEVAATQMQANASALMHNLNSVGLTAYQEMGGRGFGPQHIAPFAALAKAGQLTMRVFYNYWQDPSSPADVDRVIANIANVKPFQGDDWFDNTGYGETVYFPLHDNLMVPSSNPSPEGLQLWHRIAQAVANQGLHLNVHAQHSGSIKAFLTEIEAIHKVRPIKGLRWTFSHLDQVDADDIARMKRLDMYGQIHSRPSIQGVLMLKIHGDKAYDMPPLRLIQDSGIPWGLGSDATAVTPVNPFYTLGWAVTGKMIGGTQVLRQTISREQALIAHTRSNSYFLFEESNLGSLIPGKYADLVVLDRDYLTVPADEIKDIKPIMTMVAGKVVYGGVP